jgi:hypothetical protein
MSYTEDTKNLLKAIGSLIFTIIRWCGCTLLFRYIPKYCTPIAVDHEGLRIYKSNLLVFFTTGFWSVPCASIGSAIIDGYATFSMYVNSEFLKLTPCVQTAVTEHEKAHVIFHHIVKDDYFTSSIYEFEADLWAAERGHAHGMWMFLMKLPQDDEIKCRAKEMKSYLV